MWLWLLNNLNMGGGGSVVPAITAYPDPFAAVTATASGKPDPFAATTVTTIDPFAAVTRLKGS